MKLTTTGLTIELQARRRVDDEDWVRVQVLVSANGFRGDFEAWLQLGDLERFALKLGAMHEQVGKPVTATLASAEPDIHIELTMQALGAISGTYALESESPAGTPTRLSGAFEIDQSCLPELRQTVETLMTELTATAR